MARKKGSSSRPSSSSTTRSSRSTRSPESSSLTASPLSLESSEETSTGGPCPERLTHLYATLLGNYNAHLRGRPYRIGAAVAVCLVLVVWMGTSNKQDSQDYYVPPSAAAGTWRHHFDWRSTSAKSIVTLVPGELPGYTGWARPGTTFAGHFQLMAPLDLSQPATAGEIWAMTLRCFLAECDSGGGLFYVRAYGPSVITGQVHDNKDGTYRIELLPKEPGPYTVEVVLTFSNPPSFGQFPLPASHPQPAYEGYLLPDFPLPLQVLPPKRRHRRIKSNDQNSLPLCSMEDLLETSPTSAWEKARWVVKDKVNHPHHHDDIHKDVTLSGYLESYNSLGIQMEYEYDKCQILPPFTAADKEHVLHKCAQDKGPLHFIFIGDSVMRLQRNIFEEHFLGLPEDQREKSHYNQHKIRASYHDLTGGALRCNILGGEHNVTKFFQMLYAREDHKLEQPERYVVLFNTGLHDIHRLCGQEFREDRATYLGENSADTNQGFHCVQQYSTAIEGLAGDVRNFKADLRIFQSTTAGKLFCQPG